MNVLDRAYRSWVQLTALVALVSACSVSYVFLRKIVTLHTQAQDLYYGLLVGSLERDFAKIAEEIYLNLDTVVARERALQSTIGEAGSVKLQFLKHGLQSAETLFCEGYQSCRIFSSPVSFEGLYLGNVRMRVAFKGVDLYHELFNPAVFGGALCFVAVWAGIFWAFKKKVLEPLAVSFKEESDARAIATMAKQIAHDIRSPITALNMLTARSAGLSEEHRYLAALAVKRINSIADALLLKDKKLENHPPVIKHGDVIDVIACVEAVISEKRLELMRHRTMVDFEIILEEVGLFAEIDRTEFDRVLSNLLNNAINAQTRSGKIFVLLHRDKSEIRIEVLDHGIGIPKSVLSRVVEKGFTTGKNGSGLGLFHAKQTAETYGGSLKIESEVNDFTKVTFSLLSAEPLHPFLNSIDLQDVTHVVVVDDDESIHAVWRSRVNHEKFSALWHFVSSMEALNEVVAKLPKSSTLFLLDFDLGDSVLSGVDIIRKFRLVNTVLVTSMSDDKSVQTASHEMGIPLLPKSWISRVPIKNP